MTRYWLESQATVTKATSAVNWTGQWAEGDYVTTHTAEYTFTYGTYGWKSFDIKSMVEKWISKPDSNFGVIMKATNENTDGCDIRMYSSENASNQPYLEVTYSGILARNYYLKDHLGDIRVTIDENGTVLGYNDYYPFGLQMAGRCMNNGISDDIYKYSGKELDEEYGLNWYYFGTRYYDPAIGRWLSVDPMSEKYPALTPYNYVLDNPMKFFDPNGKWPEWYHHRFIDYAFKNEDKNVKQAYKDASDWADNAKLGHQDADKSYIHALRYYRLTVEGGINKINEYLNTPFEESITSGYDDCMVKMHCIMDMTSPSHEGVQPWGKPVELVAAMELNTATVVDVDNCAAKTLHIAKEIVPMSTRRFFSTVRLMREFKKDYDAWKKDPIKNKLDFEKYQSLFKQYMKEQSQEERDYLDQFGSENNQYYYENW